MESKIEESAPELLRFQVRRAVTNSYKESLLILEDLQAEHLDALKRLRESLPAEHRSLVDVANYWHSGKYGALRSRILRVSNNGIRDVESDIEKMEIIFK